MQLFYRNTTILLIISYISAFELFAQLPIIYASGGESFRNWTTEKQNLNDDDNPFLYGSGCTAGPIKAKVSSTLIKQEVKSYAAKNLHDADPQTAWIEGKSGYGFGEFFEVDLPYGGSNVSIFNGYQKNYDSWKNYTRVKKLKVYVDGQPICFVLLNDLMGHQEFNLPIDPMEIHTLFRFEIVSVFPGSKYDHVAISEICNLGCCFNENTRIQTALGDLEVNELYEAQKIMTIDLKTAETKPEVLTKKIEIIHEQLIQLKTPGHEIEISAYHPLFFKDYGLSNLLDLARLNNLKSIKELENHLEILVWNDKLKMLCYEPIIFLNSIHGEFKTQSILAINNATTYVINGFVSSTLHIAEHLIKK